MDVGVSRPPLLSGLAACRAYATFVLDPISCGKALHARLGPDFAVDPPFTNSRAGRRIVFTARENLIERVLGDPDCFRTVGVAVTRGPPGSAQRRLRNGVIRMSGPPQAAMRRAFAPPLSSARLNAFHDRLTQICDEEIAAWPRAARFDAAPAVKRLVRRAAAELLFGGGDIGRALKVADLMDVHSQLQYSRRTFLAPAAIPGAPYARLLRHAERVESELIAWIEDHDGEGGDLIARVASLSSCDGEPLDARARAAQLWTLFGASFETTATTLSWALLHLPWNPDCARRLAEAVAADGDAAAYLDAFVTETLRMTPPVAFQMRRAAVAGELGGCPLNPGDRILLSALVLNRDPDIYAEPDRFRPERWLGGDSTAMRPLAFSAGPRRCLGFHFAKMTLAAALSRIVGGDAVVVAGRPRIGVRIAIAQGPTRLPLALAGRGADSPPARFVGPAARQMSQR